MAKLIRRFLEKSESLEGVDCGTARFVIRPFSAWCDSVFSFYVRRVKLLCANKTEDDRMWQKELDALQASSNGRQDLIRHRQTDDRQTTDRRQTDRQIVLFIDRLYYVTKR